MWRGEADAKRRERSEEDMMINRPDDIEQVEVTKRKPAAPNFKKAEIGEGYTFPHNQEVRSRKLRATKKLEYPEDQTQRPRRKPSSIARAGEALLAKPSVQRAIAAALVANQNDSFEGNNNPSINQTELPSRITPYTDDTPRMRLQHKLLDQARIRTTISRYEYEYLETLASHSEEDQDAHAVDSGHGAGPAPHTVEDTAASGDGVVTESESDPKDMDSAAKNDLEVGLDQDDTKECCICLDAPATHIFAPCFHLCICAKCQIPYANGTVRECPMCREEFKNVGKVF